MNTRFTALFVALLLTACSAESDPVSTISVATDDGETTLASGEIAELAGENREALVLVVNGIVSSGRVYATELVKVHSGVYRDHDAGIGPEFWIMESSIEDADGKKLWTDRENSLFQLLEFLEIVLSQLADINISAANVYRFVKANYPSLLDFAVRVPMGVEGGVDYVLRMPDEDGALYEVGRWKIDDLIAQAKPSEAQAEVTTLVDSGPPEDKIDFVILGDGYLMENREKFDLDAQAVVEALMSSEPFKTHGDMINVHTIWTPSAETGAGYDCTGNPLIDRNCKRDLRDTVFGTTFVVTALSDLLNFDLGTSDRVAMPLNVAKLYEVAALANYDEIILIVNTRRRSGFAGLYVSVVTAFDSNRSQFPNIAVHELGHSFGVLGDEYQAQSDACLNNEPRVPLPANIAALGDPDEFKWTRWFGGPTPIPTPEDQRDLYPIGAYLGGYNCDDLYRPAYACKMNSDESLPFCDVCNEQVTRRIYSVLDPIANTPRTVTATDGGAELEIPLHQPDIWEVVWTIDGKSVGTGPKLTIDAADLTNNWTTVVAEVTENTGFILIEDPATRQTFEFRVKR